MRIDLGPDNVSERLVELLRTRNDDGTPPLYVWWGPRWKGRLVIARHDGSDISPTERAHVEATLAAHAAEPIE